MAAQAGPAAYLVAETGADTGETADSGDTDVDTDTDTDTDADEGPTCLASECAGDGGCTCSSVSGAALGGWMLLGLPLVGLRRRS